MTANGADDLLERALSAGQRAGIDHLGVCDAAPFDDTRRVLEQRAAAGLSASMQFTYRNPARSTDPARTLPTARSLVVGALGYAAPVPPPPAGPRGRVARYATEDHYAALRHGLEQVAGVLRDAGHQARVLADDNALVDRAAAVRAGLGWYGKSANVLVPGHGSWFVLGSVLTDAVLGGAELGGRPEPVADGCGACTRCLDGCPTSAIVAPGVVDARRCLAWMVQDTADLPREHRVALGDRVYGCDECQEVCPPSRREETRVTLVTPTPPDTAWVDLLELLEADDDELLARHGRWYVPQRDPRYLRRNALVALANSVAEHATADPHDPRLCELLGAALDSGDTMLVGHAAWAALRIGRADLLEVGERVHDPAVRAELAHWPDGAARREDGPR
jgi:epoxyqueuosine reductase